MRKNLGLSSGPARTFGDLRWLLPFLASLLIMDTLLLATACELFSPPYPARLWRRGWPWPGTAGEA